MSYETSVYYHPEKNKLETVASWDFSDGCYQFDYRCVWRNDRGELLTARDSGCSCPSPFEDVALSDLTSVSIEELKQEAIDESRRDGYGGDSLSEILEKINKLKGDK